MASSRFESDPGDEQPEPRTDIDVLRAHQHVVREMMRDSLDGAILLAEWNRDPADNRGGREL